MRQGQNSKRSRGRGRKPQNSANRSYESNGPDVKIRGTAAHVCEKYQQLARDAISAGDRVTAENYFQHAEHYYRLLMAAQTGQDSNRQTTASLGYRPNDEEEDEYESSNDGSETNGGSAEASNGKSDNRADNKSDNKADNQDEDAGRDKKSAASNGEDEGQPRRRQNRRRRPRTEARDGAADGVDKSGGDSGSDGVSGKTESKADAKKADAGSDKSVGADGAAA